jgi:hypothetical protein
MSRPFAKSPPSVPYATLIVGNPVPRRAETQAIVGLSMGVSSPGYVAIENTLGVEIHRALRGDISDRVALENVQRELDRVTGT